MTLDEHVGVIDDALDALAADPDITSEQYTEALEQIHYAIGASLEAQRGR